MPIFRKRKTEPAGPHCTCIVAAAGGSTRMGGNKLLFDLCGIPVIIRSLLALQFSMTVDDIIVVTRGDLIPVLADAAKEYGVSKLSLLCSGGETRQESVMEGLSQIDNDEGLTAIHDGARPLVRPEDIDRVTACAAEHGAAVLAVPVKDTIKIAREDVVAGTLPRETLWSVQTPQAFRTALIKAAYRRAFEERTVMTDDCTAVERLGKPVRIVRGSYKNIKLTTPEDVLVAQQLLQGELPEEVLGGVEFHADRSRL